MSPGRASAALTTSRLFLPASAFCTQVCTAAQPPPSILWPLWASDQVTKLAHHGLPGATPASLRYLSTSAPVLTPSSWTPLASSPFATSSAEAPRLLEPPEVAVAASATTPGREPAATALAGPAGGCMKDSSSPCLGAAALAASSAVTARKLSESPALCGGAAAAAAGAAGAAAAAAAGGGAEAALPRRSLASSSLSW